MLVIVFLGVEKIVIRNVALLLDRTFVITTFKGFLSFIFKNNINFFCGGFCLDLEVRSSLKK